MRRFELALLGCVLWSSAAAAHDIWLTTTAAPVRVVVNYGHPTERSLPDVDKIINLVAITPEKTLSLIEGLVPGEALGKPVLVSKPFAAASALLVARYDNGYFVKTADGYRNTSKRLFPDAPDSLWSIKFAKTILGPDAPWQRVLGQSLELVPTANPATLAPGSRLRVRVLFGGHPLAGAEVERGDGIAPIADKDIPRFKTDQDGVVAIPIVKPGPQLLAIDYMVKPSATPALADTDFYNATLFFIVAGAK